MDSETTFVSFPCPFYWREGPASGFPIYMNQKGITCILCSRGERSRDVNSSSLNIVDTKYVYIWMDWIGHLHSRFNQTQAHNMHRLRKLSKPRTKDQEEKERKRIECREQPHHPNPEQNPTSPQRYLPYRLAAAKPSPCLIIQNLSISSGFLPGIRPAIRSHLQKAPHIRLKVVDIGSAADTLPSTNS